MRRGWGRAWIVWLAVGAPACVKQTVTRNPAVPPVARQTAFERQISNARDAGDGDIQLRELRERVAEEPDNIPARLDLARAYADRGYPDVALEMARLASARFPDSGAVELALVRYLHDLRQPAEAIASWKVSSRRARRPIPGIVPGSAFCAMSAANIRSAKRNTARPWNWLRQTTRCTTTWATTC